MSLYLPLPVPLPPSNATTPSPLAADQESKRSQVLNHFAAEGYKLPNATEDGTLMDKEKFWLSDECIQRYLRATKWDTPSAIERLEDTLQWRREYGLYDTLTAELVEPEAVTGKQVLFGFDAKRRPALYLLPSKQNTTEPLGQIQFTVWMLERAVDMTGIGVESLALLINFGDRGKNPSISVGRTVLNILQSHYPERLGGAYIIQVPYLVNLFFKVILPFVDPITRAKIFFNPDVVPEKLFEPDMVMKKWWGGNVEFEYEHEKYWAELVRLCREKTEAEMKCWREMGAKLGTSEWEVKTAATKLLQPGQVFEKGVGAPAVDLSSIQDTKFHELGGDLPDTSEKLPGYVHS